MKVKSILIICNLAMAMDLSCGAVLAADPMDKFIKQSSNSDQSQGNDITAQYFSGVAKQIASINKQFSANNIYRLPNANLASSNNQQTNSKNPIVEQISKISGLFKNLVYNPDNPSPFFNSLISLQTASLGAQSQMIMWSEKVLGPKNNYVMGLKENYRHTLKTAEALEQQKILLEQQKGKH